MNCWERQTDWVKITLVVVILSMTLPIRQADAYLSKTPTAFSEDGRLLLVQMSDLVLWDLESKALLAKVPLSSCQQVMLLKQDGWVMCVANEVVIYDWKAQASVATIPAESRQPYSVLAYSNQSDRMVLRHGNDAVSVWQLGKKLVPLKHIALDVKKKVPSVAASPDLKMLAIAQGHTIHLHDLAGTAIRDLTIEDGEPHDLLFSPHGSTLAASVGNTILLIDTVEASLRARATLTVADGARGSITPRVFSRDGHRLVAGNGEWSYPLFDADTGKQVSLTEFTYADQERGVRSHTYLYAVDISDDADYLVGQPEYPSTLQMWDLRTGSLLPDLCGNDCRNMGPRVSLLRWSPTGSKIVVGMQGGQNPDVDGKISVWDVQTRSPELVLDPSQPQAKVLAKRVVPDVVAAEPSVNSGGPSAASARPAFIHALAVRSMASSPSANVLATTGDDGMLKIWDPGQGRLLRQLVLASPGSALAFSADGLILAMGTTKGEIRLWETQTWREFPSYSSRQGRINALQFLPGNRLLVVAGEQPKVPVVDVSTREVMKELVHTGFSQACDTKGCVKKRAIQGEVVESLSLVDGSPFLLTESRNGRAVWDTRTWREIDKPVGLPDVWSGLGWKRPFVSTTIRPGDQKVFTLAVWDTKRNGIMASLDTFTKRDTEIVENGPTVALGTSMAVDPLYRWAATRIGEHVSVWDLSVQAKKKTFHVKTPSHLHWTSDGKYLLVSTLDRKMLVWSAETMEPVHYLRDPSITR
ncbi:MAG: WD40 repeat domain-containing protein [Nitrospira sp. BO4]|nr:WD40 repeat domain-containing protein [Nitrospira sp. BO4]